MRRPVPGLSVVMMAVALSSLVACEKESKPSLNDMESEVKQKEDKKKADDADTAAKEKSALDALTPKIADARKSLEQKLSAVYDALPKDPQKLKRENCPDSKLTTDVPNVDQRKLLIVNQEVLYRLAGKPEGGSPAFHTLAGDDAISMVRRSGKETPLIAKGPPATSADAQAVLDAAAFVASHRYLGVAMVTRYRGPHSDGAVAKPPHLEAFTVIFDKDNAKYLCQVEGSADNLVNKGEAVTVGSPLFEDLWAMYLVSASRNMDAITKELSVEGAPSKKH